MRPKPKGILDLHRSTLESRRVRKEFENANTLKLLAEENVLRECMQTRRGDQSFSAVVQRDIFHENHMRSIIDARKRVIDTQTEMTRKFDEEVKAIKEKEELKKEALRKHAQRQLLFNNSQELQEMQLRIRCAQNSKELTEQLAQREIARHEQKNKDRAREQVTREMREAEAADRLDRERSSVLREKYKRELEDQIRWKEVEIENQKREQMKEATEAQAVRAMTAHENRRFMDHQTEQRRQLRESIDAFLKQCAASKRKEKSDSAAVEERIDREARNKMQWEETLEEMRKEKIRQRQALQQESEKMLLQVKPKQVASYEVNYEEQKRQWEMEEKKKCEEEARRRKELQDSFLAQIKNREMQLLEDIIREERYEAQLREKEISENREREIAEMKRRRQQKGMLDDLQQQINDLLYRKSLEKSTSMDARMWK